MKSMRALVTTGAILGILTGCPLAIGPDWKVTLTDWKDTLKDLFSDDGNRKITLADLFIDDGTGPKPYLEVVGPSPDTKWYDRGLPLGQVLVYLLQIFGGNPAIKIRFEDYVGASPSHIRRHRHRPKSSRGLDDFGFLVTGHGVEQVMGHTVFG